MTVLVRILVAIAVIVFTGIVIDTMADSGIAVALWQWLVWAGRAIVNAIGAFSKAAAAWLQRILKRSVMRRFTRPMVHALSIALLAVIVRRHGKWAVYREIVRSRAWLRLQHRHLARVLGDVWNYQPRLPRAVRALVALCLIALFVWMFFYINAHFGVIESFLFSMAASLLVERLPLIGFEALISITAERWQPAREWRDRLVAKYPRTSRWLTWLWFKPALEWLHKKLIVSTQPWEIKRERRPSARSLMASPNR
jgi:hypothetical protein